MGVFWWIPALMPLVGALILLACPGKWAWPIAKWEGADSVAEIERNWAKFGIYLGVNFLACLLFAWGSWHGAVSKQYFHEVWNYRIVGISHEMEWTEEVMYTVTVDDGDTTDSEGHTTHHSHTEIRYRTDHFGPFWKATDEYGSVNSINESDYNEWKSRWADEKQTGMHKGSSAGFDRSIDGPIFGCEWPKTFATIYPWSEIHRYVNKIRVSHSVLKYGEPTKQQLARFPRPADQGNVTPIINYGRYPITADDVLLLRRINADCGRRNEIHSLLVIFGKDEGRGVVTDVLTAWQGPNKNELVTFVSLDGNTIRWVEVHSWMDNTTLHATLRDELAGQPFTVERYAGLLQKHVPALWHRKHFTPINSYLHVSINPGWIWLALILSVITGIISYFVIEKVMDDGYGGGGRTWGDDPAFWEYRDSAAKKYGRSMFLG